MTIIKKIYFHDNSYSENKNNFKKLLVEYGVLWDKNSMKFYNIGDNQVMSGIFTNTSGSRKIMAIYEGSGKPVTIIIKFIGSESKFLIKILSFCNRIGCTIEDKSDDYVKRLVDILRTHGDISILDRKNYVDILDNDKIILDSKIDIVVKRNVDKYMNSVSKIYGPLGYNLLVVRYFKEMDIRKNIISMLNHRLDKFVFAELD